MSLRITENYSISDAKVEELQKQKKKQIIDFLKDSKQFGGVSTKVANKRLEQAYGQIKSWKSKA